MLVWAYACWPLLWPEHMTWIIEMTDGCINTCDMNCITGLTWTIWLEWYDWTDLNHMTKHELDLYDGSEWQGHTDKRIW